LLREAMAQSNKVAVASLVLRTKEHLVTIRPTESVLALETMYFADEIRDPMKEIPSVPAEVEFSGRELSTAKLLIDSMVSAWDPSLYEDVYRKRVEGLIEEKRQGKVIVTERPETQPTKVVDLMEALQASVEAARSHRPGAAIATGGTSAGTTGKDRAKGSARRAGAGSSSPSEASGLSKTELQARATELGIPGRSKMTRQELETAVTGATKPAKRRKAS
jgi:DNA end-binding protein Ku